MSAGESFAAILANICPRIVDGAELGAASGLTRVEGTPSFLRDYPRETHWFTADTAPRNVFVSIDVLPEQRRCRVVLANNRMALGAHMMTGQILQRQGAQAISSGYEPRRNLRESIWLLPKGDRALLFGVQTVPQPERGGRGWQGTATAVSVSRERARQMGLDF
jgi:hypothetical protein